MRLLLVSILFLAIIGHTFSKGVIVANYLVNKDFIANNLCENKSKPELNCDGQCQLKKQLDKEDRDNQTTSREIVELILYCKPFEVFDIMPTTTIEINKKKFDYYKESLPDDFFRNIFHPPIAVI